MTLSRTRSRQRGPGGSACSGAADIYRRRATRSGYRLTALVLLGIGLIMLATGGPLEVVALELLLAIGCAVMSLWARDRA